MPSIWQALDNHFPSFSGNETPQQQIQALHNYLYELRQGLRFSLQNLGVQNFNEAELQKLTDAQKTELSEMLQGVKTSLSNLTANLNSLSGRIGDLEKLAGIIRLAEDGSVTVGAEGRVLRLTGDIYINDAKWEEAKDPTDEETAPEDQTTEETTPEDTSADETTSGETGADTQE